MRVISKVFTRMAERYLPDAFIFVFALTILVFILGLFKGFGPGEVIGFWGNGFFDILEFTAQSTMMLVTGFALAHTPLVNRALKSFARIPKTEVHVIVLTTLVMMVCSWISWGFGLIAGAIVAREMGIVHRGKIHYPLVVASTYAGFLVWHAGYGGAIPTLIATPGHFLEEQMGVIPVSETIFASHTVIIVIALAIVLPISMVLMRPKSGEPRISLPDSVLAEEEVSGSVDPGTATQANTEAPPAARLEEKRIITLILGLLGLTYLVIYFINGGALNINIVILSFLSAGLLLTPHTKEYLATITGGAKAAYGIILQFPFYAGIMAMITQTGLVKDIANFFVSISSAQTLPFWTFIAGGIINIFIPSGGGQWAVQGPIAMETVNLLGADAAKVAMAVAWGDSWTNMIQPFWTLPLLAIAGLGIRHIMGYTAVICIISGIVIGLGLLIL